MVFAGSLIWYHTKRQTHIVHTATNKLTNTYKYMLTPPVMCTQQVLVLHWMNSLMIQKFSLQRPTMSLLFKNYLLVEVIHLLISFNKTKSFLWKAKNTDRNSINEQNTPITHRERKIALERLVCDSFPFWEQPSCFTSLNPHFLGKFQKLNQSPSIKGGGFELCLILYLLVNISLLNCASSRLRALPIIDTRLTRLHNVPIINTRLRAFNLTNKRLTRLFCLVLLFQL